MVSGIAQEQHHAVDRSVALLEHDATNERLVVAHPRLRLDPYRPSEAVDRGIPGSEIDRAGEGKLDHRDLEAPSELGSQSNAKPFEQGHVGVVADRGADRIAACCKLEPDDGAQLSQALERDARNLAPADPRDLHARHAHRAADDRVSKSAFQPRSVDLATDLDAEMTRPIRSSVDRALSSRHPTTIAVGPYVALTASASVRR